MEIASWLGPYAGATGYDEGRPYISAIDGPAGPIVTGDHLTRDMPTNCVLLPPPLYSGLYYSVRDQKSSILSHHGNTEDENI